MNSTDLHTAAFLPASAVAQFSGAVPDCLFHSVATPDDIPPSCVVLIAAPSAMLRSMERPGGWPGHVRWVHLLSSGIDDYPAWLLDDVMVTRSPAISAVPLAEYCLSAILTWSRQPQSQPVTDPTQWRAAQARRVSGTDLGIVGMGAVGTALASRALALGMGVRAIRASDKPMPDGVTRSANLAELVAMSDTLVLAAPAAPDTRHLIDSAVLAHARPGLHLVNVARGSLINNSDLLDALGNGQVAFATLDVTDPEPLPLGHAFYTHPAIRLTAHCAAYDDKLLPDLIALFASHLRHFSETGDPHPRV